MPNFKGFGKPPEPNLLFTKDLKGKINRLELQPNINISSQWLQSLTTNQKDRLCKETVQDKVSADIAATVIMLACLEQNNPNFEFTKEDAASWLHNFLTLVSIRRMVDNGLMKVTHFPPIHRDDKFGSRLIAKEEAITKLIEAEAEA